MGNNELLEQLQSNIDREFTHIKELLDARCKPCLEHIKESPEFRERIVKLEAHCKEIAHKFQELNERLNEHKTDFWKFISLGISLLAIAISFLKR